MQVEKIVSITLNGAECDRLKKFIERITHDEAITLMCSGVEGDVIYNLLQGIKTKL